jgi:hypothetical protein
MAGALWVGRPGTNPLLDVAFETGNAVQDASGDSKRVEDGASCVDADPLAACAYLHDFPCPMSDTTHLLKRTAQAVRMVVLVGGKGEGGTRGKAAGLP